MRALSVLLIALLALAGCAKSTPAEYERAGWLVGTVEGIMPGHGGELLALDCGAETILVGVTFEPDDAGLLRRTVIRGKYQLGSRLAVWPEGGSDQEFSAVLALRIVVLPPHE